jgi:N-acetyl-alpha-D-muramate 1-phosphate uridylyltransferase
MKAMILSAGLGTRLKPWTDMHPKALAPVNGKSLLQRNVEYLQCYDIFDVIVNVHHFADQIRDEITRNKGWGSNITISDETDVVLETGGGLQKASWYFDEAQFVVMNVDVLTDLNLHHMLAAHLSEGPLATIAVTERKTSRYFLFDPNNNLCGWRNVLMSDTKISRDANELRQKAFSGIHIINKRFFSLLTRKGKFSMVDVYLDLAKDHIIKGFDHSDSRFIDVGKPESVAVAEELFV